MRPERDLDCERERDREREREGERTGKRVFASRALPPWFSKGASSSPRSTKRRNKALYRARLLWLWLCIAVASMLYCARLFFAFS